MTDFNITVAGHDVGKAISDRFLVNAGYTTARTGRCISKDGADEFIKALSLAGYDVYDLREFDHTITAFSDDKSLYIYIDLENNYTDIYVKEGVVGGIVSFFHQFQEHFTYRNPDIIGIEYHYHHPVFGPQSRDIYMDRDRLQTTIPELYPDYDVGELTKQFLASDDNILLLYGPPGVGKTQFVRYIMKHCQFDEIVYVKDTEVLNSGDFWANQSGRDTGLMVFDDMDDALKPRQISKRRRSGESKRDFEQRKYAESQNDSFMRNVLSFTDGVFEKKTKIIITTNQPLEEVDSAVIRPGRCFDFLTLHPLTYDEAAAIWVHTLNNDPASFADKFGGQEQISQATLMTEHRRMANKFVERSYVKRGDRNYSVESKLRAAGVTIGG